MKKLIMLLVLSITLASCSHININYQTEVATKDKIELDLCKTKVCVDYNIEKAKILQENMKLEREHELNKLKLQSNKIKYYDKPAGNKIADGVAVGVGLGVGFEVVKGFLR